MTNKSRILQIPAWLSYFKERYFWVWRGLKNASIRMYLSNSVIPDGGMFHSFELKEKPSPPVGEQAEDAFGDRPDFEDVGNIDRAILNIGKEDVDNNIGC